MVTRHFESNHWSSVETNEPVNSIDPDKKRQDQARDLRICLINGSDRDLLNDGLHEGSGNKGGVWLPDHVLCAVKVITCTAHK